MAVRIETLLVIGALALVIGRARADNYNLDRRDWFVRPSGCRGVLCGPLNIPSPTFDPNRKERIVLAVRAGMVTPLGWGHSATSARLMPTGRVSGTTEVSLGCRCADLVTMYGGYTAGWIAGGTARLDLAMAGARVHANDGWSPLVDLAFGWYRLYRRRSVDEGAPAVRLAFGVARTAERTRFEVLLDATKPLGGPAFAGLSIGGAVDL